MYYTAVKVSKISKTWKIKALLYNFKERVGFTINCYIIIGN